MAPVSGPRWVKTSSPEVISGGGDPGGPEALDMAKGGVGWPDERSNRSRKREQRFCLGSRCSRETRVLFWQCFSNL